MGRWKRKQYRKKQERDTLRDAQIHYEQGLADTRDVDWQDDEDGWSNNKQDSSFMSSSRGIPGWTWKERRDVLRYLEQYKAGCECIYAGLDPICQEAVVTIGMVEFPMLTLDVFEQPYLSLPATLTSKNRRMIHECCAESFLFHMTSGERSSRLNRSLVISIYVNGFENVPNLVQKLPTMDTDECKNGNSSETMGFYHPPIHRFRPWYSRKDRPWLLDPQIDPSSKQPPSCESAHLSSTPILSNTASSSRGETLDAKGKSLIDALIDNPESCLRDDLDVIDFATWDKADLANISLSKEYSLSAHTPSCIGNDGQVGWTLVDSAEMMKQCIAKLWACRPTEIGFDLESLNTSKYSQLTCLLQITSNAGHDFVIDTLAPDVWDMIGVGLAPFFADPNIVKVGRSIGGLDVRSLHRDFGVFVVNAFDTYEAAQVLGLCSRGLASVCAHYGLEDSDRYKNLKAEYQATDWRRRPLTNPMLEYARYDVHYLLKLRLLMIRDLTRADLYDQTPAERDEEASRIATSMASALAQFKDDEDMDDAHDGDRSNKANAALPGNQDQDLTSSSEIFRYDHDDDNEDDDIQQIAENVSAKPALSSLQPKASAALLRMQPNLMKVISRSQERCRDLWSGRTEPFLTHPMYINILHRARRDEVEWTPEHLKLYEELVVWRKCIAEEREILPGFVAPLTFLIPVALQRPVSEMALRRVSFHFPELVEEDQSCRDSLLEVVKQSVSINGSNSGYFDGFLLEYGNVDAAAYSKLRAKHGKKQKRRNRRLKSRSRRRDTDVVDWRVAAIIVVVAGIAAVAMAGHRLKR